MDGWDVELFYRKTEKDKKGHLVTTCNNRVNMVIVLDACMNYPIGYAVGTQENGELIREALKNAANHSRELFGRRYSTRQLPSDRFGIKSIKQISEAGFARHFTPAKAKNAKAKPIEPYNGYINNTYCRMFPNRSGYGVQSDRDRQPASEFLNMNKKNFPDYAGLLKQIDMIMAMERGRKLEAYRALFEQMPQDKLLPMTDENCLMIFGTNNGHRQLLQHSGLTLTVRGQKYIYDCFDINFRRHSSTRWEVRYDESDMSIALAVNEDESLRFVIEEKYLQPMALTERKEGDAAELKRVNDFNEELKQHIIDTHERYSGFAGGKTPALTDSFKLDGTLEKLMLTDSEGQHKSRRHEERQKSGQTAVPAVTEEECVFEGY
jgi:hypothetical protein